MPEGVLARRLIDRRRIQFICASTRFGVRAQ